MGKKLYEVEKIIDKKRNQYGNISYLVKWVGYSDEECTWEPLANLSTVKEMIEEFEKVKGKEYDRKWKIGNIEEDAPKYILDAELKPNFELFMKIRWKKRRANIQPADSLVPYQVIKKKYPYLVLEYFEKHIHVKNFGNKKIKYDEKKDKYVIKEK